MKRFLLLAAFIITSIASSQAQYVDACITANTVLQNGPSPKSLWVCRGATVSLHGDNCLSTFPPGYNPAYVTYTWQYLKVPSTIVTSTGQNKAVKDSGRYVLTVRYVDVANAINVLDRDTLWIRFYGTSVKINQKNTAGIAIKCASDSILLTSSILPAASAGTVSNYAWYITGNSTPISTTSTVKVKNVAYYVVTADESTYGCSIRDTVLLQNYSNPIVNLGIDKDNCGGNVTLSSNPDNPGVTLNLYTWYKNGVVVASGPPTVITIPGPPSYTYTAAPPYTATTAGQYVLLLKAQGTNCVNSDTVNVIVRPGPDFTLIDSSICFTASMQIVPVINSVVAPVSYLWAASPDLSDVNISSPIANPLTSGPHVYSLTVSDANNCPVTKSVTITKYTELISSTLFADSTICTDSSITLVANNATGSVGPYTYSWKDANNIEVAPGQSGTVSVSQAIQTFHIVVVDSKRCKDSSYVDIHTTEPTANLGPDVYGQGNQPVTLDPHSGTSVNYDWFATGNGTSLGTTPTLTVSTADTFSVVVIHKIYGCKVSDTIIVFFTPGNPELIFVPNAFSPEAGNADDKVVKVYGEGLTADGFEFNIYDRWGAIVYSTTNLVEAKNTGWQGSTDNKEGSQNVYTYSVKGKYVTGKSFEQTGTITMLR